MPDALGETRAQAQLEVVHADVVEDAVRPREIDVFEDARVQLRCTCTLWSARVPDVPMRGDVNRQQRASIEAALHEPLQC